MGAAALAPSDVTYHWRLLRARIYISLCMYVTAIFGSIEIKGISSRHMYVSIYETSLGFPAAFADFR